MASERDERVFVFGDFRLDARQRVLEQHGDLVPLPPKAVDLLLLLVSRAGEVVDKQTIFDTVWAGTFVVESSLTKNISLLRKTLDANAEDSVIQTVAKRGYRFSSPVRIVQASPPPAARRIPRAAVAALVCLTMAIAVGYAWRNRLPGGNMRSAADSEAILGRYVLGKAEPSALPKALARFEKAAELDARSATAHAGVADSLLAMATSAVGSPSGNLARAREAATRALTLDPDSARAHLGLARVHLLADFNFTAAEAELKRAWALDPTMPDIPSFYGCLLSARGELDAANAMHERAHALDPADPGIAVAHARNEIYRRRYPSAVTILNEVLDRDPHFSHAHYHKSVALGFLGRTTEALTHLDKAQLNPDLLATDAAWLHSIEGDRSPAALLLAEREILVASGRRKPTSLVLPAIAAGNLDLALRSLEAMIPTHEIELLDIVRNPRFDALRTDTRFQALCRRVQGR